MGRARALAILRGEDRSLAAAAARALLAAGEPVYRAAVGVRNGRFDSGRRVAVPLGRRAVSVGNLTTGGTGKTPVVIDLARRLVAADHRPAVLLRGYGAAGGVSDEASELRDALPGVPVGVHPSRVEGARAVLAATPEVDCFVLDDGFQHRQVARDLDLVLIDATCPWGHGHLLPRGLLREPRENLRRASAVIVTRADRVERDELARLDREIGRLAGGPPLAHAAHRWTALRPADGGVDLPVSHLAGLPVFAASGIGNPAAFEATLAASGARVVGSRRFDDHHAYRDAELAALLGAARDAGARCVLTTEKDFVKWRALGSVAGPPVPVLRPVLGIDWLDGGRALEALLGGLFSRL